MSAIPAASVSLKTMADGTLRISFDIEPIHAQDAFKLFAAPGTQAAIAALKAGTYLEQPNIQSYPAKDIPAISKTETPDKPKGGELCRWAALRCKDPHFFIFIQPVYRQYIGDVGPDDFYKPEWFCRHAVMVLSGCEYSRSELDNDPVKAANFHTRVRTPFMAWQAAQ